VPHARLIVAKEAPNIALAAFLGFDLASACHTTGLPRLAEFA